jgi:LmbE family N-acetylglucosaminyl deacetylase
MYPNAKVKTITPYGGYSKNGKDGQHPDHRALGQAAQELYNEGKIKDLRFYVEPYQLDIFNPDGLSGINYWCTTTNSNGNAKLDYAISKYKYFNVSNVRYAIGYQ